MIAVAEFDEEIIRLYDAGWSMNQIGMKLHGSRSWVRNRLIANQIPLRRQGGGHPAHYSLSYADIERTTFLYQHCKLTIYEVADMLGLNASTVIGRLERAGIPRRTKREVAALKRQREMNDRLGLLPKL